MQKFSSSCHCGKIQCSFTLPVTAVVQCHCQNCRKLQGSDYSTWVAVHQQQFSIDRGEEHLVEYRANDQSSKIFCSHCGTGVFCINGKHFKHHKVLPLGSIDNYSFELAPFLKVYTENKAAWLKLHDDIPITTGNE